MRVLLLSVLLLFVCLAANGQEATPLSQQIASARKAGQSFPAAELFSYKGSVQTDLKDALTEGIQLSLDPSSLQSLYQQKLPSLLLRIPRGDQPPLELELVEQEPVAATFTVRASSLGGTEAPYQPGRHYRGIIKGQTHSLVALSIFENELMGVLAQEGTGNMVIGHLPGKSNEQYILYQERHLLETPDFDCSYLGMSGKGESPAYSPSTGEKVVVNNCVEVYLECEYNMYQEYGSIQGTVNYMTGLFNVVSTLYQNEQIPTVISEIYVWDTPDSYATSSTSAALNSFRSFRPGYNGDLAHLVSRGAPTGGGIAWVDVLCTSFGYAYSYIYSSYNDLPAYSWSVNVLTHEMGHNLGSRHTHDCAWTVNGVPDQAIDGCGTAAGAGGGPCPAGPIPASGTIMSYCHLIPGVGIDLSLGFGPIPGDLIRSRVQNAGCLNTCSSGCDLEVNTTHTNNSCFGESAGMATATGAGGATPYSYVWSNGASSATISGLSAGNYTVTVTDATACEATKTVSIQEPPALQLQFTITGESAPGAGNGSIQAYVSGGIPAYSFQWSNGATGQNLSNLSSGTYSVTVSDANNCTKTGMATVGADACDNQVTSFPFEESFESNLGDWSQVSGDDFNWTRDANGTPTGGTGPDSGFDGNFYLYTEANTNVNSTAILQSPCLDLTDLDSPVLSFAYHMKGDHTGSLTIQASTDNGQSWSTLWTKSGEQGAAWKTKTLNLASSISEYTLIRLVAHTGFGTLSDMAIDALSVASDEAACDDMNLNFNFQAVSCSGEGDGMARVLADGGSEPYSYAWSTGVTEFVISDLSGGNYSVTVTDAAGCVLEGSVVVEEPDPLQLNLNADAVSGPGASDGKIETILSGGTPPYSYLWSNGAQSQNLNNLSPGWYGLTVTDDEGCTAEASVQIAGDNDCTPFVGLPYTEGFEEGFGDWVQETTDNFNWSRNTGTTPTGDTGPDFAAEGDYYLYTEANNNTNQVAILQGPCFDLTQADQPMFTYHYHLYGDQIGKLSLELSTDAGNSWIPVQVVTGDQGNSWRASVLDLSPYAGQLVRLRFVARVGGMYSDMAIDDLLLEDETTTSVTDWTDEWEIRLFPNPTGEDIQIDLNRDTDHPVSIYVYDSVGRLLLEEEAFSNGANSWRKTVGHWPSGLYWIHLTDQEQKRVMRFVIR